MTNKYQTIQCPHCYGPTLLHESSQGICHDCLFLEVKELIDEKDFSEFECLEVDEFFEEVDTECWDVSFVFHYKDVKFYCGGMATGSSSIGFEPESMESGDLLMDE